MFPTTTGAGLMVGYRKRWQKIAELAELPVDVTPHVLRHSFASLAAHLGYSEPIIVGLIGHKLHSITSRYVDSADAALLAAANAVAVKTAAMMADREAASGSAPQQDDARLTVEATIL